MSTHISADPLCALNTLLSVNTLSFERSVALGCRGYYSFHTMAKQNFFIIVRSEKPNLRKLGERVTSYLDVIPEDVAVDVTHAGNEG